jgi:hypothetical protein
MGSTLATSENVQGELVIAATLIFLLFAGYGLVVSAGSVDAESQQTADSTPPPSVGGHIPIRAIMIITGLICGLAVLAVAGC